MDMREPIMATTSAAFMGSSMREIANAIFPARLEQALILRLCPKQPIVQQYGVRREV